MVDWAAQLQQLLPWMTLLHMVLHVRLDRTTSMRHPHVKATDSLDAQLWLDQ
jgi:hypothetical protein